LIFCTKPCIVPAGNGNKPQHFRLPGMKKIKSVIFDWGGVLIENPAPGLIQYCAQVLKVSQEDFAKVHHKFSVEFQKNLIPEETFWNRICRQLKVPKPGVRSLWSEAFKAAYIPRAGMFNLVASLQKSGYKTAVLSNTEIPAMQYFYQLQYDMFDVLVFSCAEGAIKPERKIFDLTIQKLDCLPEQSVFIDDNPEFINGAKNAGLNTILYKSTGLIREKLAEFGIKLTD
jgi:epoxide hydrolase-like predicted phosphatase